MTSKGWVRAGQGMPGRATGEAVESRQRFLMATLVSGLGGAAGYGEQSFKTSTLSGGNLDDGFISVNTTSVFGAGGININGTSYSNIFISTNGLITFQSGVTSYTPAALTTLGQPSLSPFWTDADINKGGDIYWDLDPVSGKITVTWLNVAAYQGPGTNSFQVIITATGGGDFTAEFIYGSIGYTNGYAGNATAGFSNGTTQTLLEGSGDPAVLATYASNDFDTNDPAGIYGMGFEAGTSFTGDGNVEGTAGNDNINSSYTGDPDGDRIDAGDATGFGGTTGNGDYVTAGAGNDTVTAGLGNDIVFGGDGNDSVLGGYGADTVDGGNQNDTIDGGSGNDSLEGGAGDDVISGGAAAGAISYTPTYSEVTAATQNVTGAGGRPNFSVRTVSSDNDLTNTGTNGTNGTVSGFRIGNADSTETHTHTASSQIAGGQILFNGMDTNEQFAIQIDGVTVNLTTAIANGTVTFNGGTFYGINGSGQIVRTGGSGTNPTTVGTLTINVPYTTLTVVATGSNTSGTTSGFFYEYYVNTQPLPVAAEAGGNDTLSGGAGNDSLVGGDGNDVLSGGNDTDTLVGGTGNDSLSGDLGTDLLQGDEGDDTLSGGGGADTLAGGVGNDSLSGGTENDSLSGEAGSDTLLGDEGDDTLSGGADADSLIGGTGNDSLSGDGGADTLAGGDGDDRLFGGTDNDSLSGEIGNDTVSGGDGDDRLFGGTGNDSLTGDLGSDTISGDAGADVLSGGDGADSLSGGDDNDTLIGGQGADTLVGGAGLDVADYGTSGAALVIDLQAGTVAGGDATGDSLSGIEGLTGGSQNDRLLGDDTNANLLTGAGGDDSLDGRGGNDSLFGGIGQDTLIGGTGNDLLDGGDGNDLIFAGDGADTISGGIGNDSIFQAGIGDVIDGGENAGDQDTIDLSNWGWKRTKINYTPGNAESGTVDFLDTLGNTIGSMQFSNIEKMIPCFTPGTRIVTRRGEVAVETLVAGDEVLTLDGGFRPLVWTGKRDLSAADLLAQPALRPIRIAAGSLGNGLPVRDMLVSPQHRMLMAGHRAEMLFGDAEVLVAAKHLVGMAGVEPVLRRGVTYVHIMFDRHEIVCADGAWSESFQPSRRMVGGMGAAQAAEILALFPELAAKDIAFRSARLSLKAHEARVLLAA